MPILNYSTSISAEKTISEIQKSISKRGASKIMLDYEDGIPIALTFCMNIPAKNGGKNMVGFKLPANYEGVFQSMKSSKVVKRLRTKEQAIKVSWRIIRMWVDAQMAMVDAELASMEEIFLPYALTSNGRTVYQELIVYKSSNIKFLTE